MKTLTRREFLQIATAAAAGVVFPKLESVTPNKIEKINEPTSVGEVVPVIEDSEVPKLPEPDDPNKHKPEVEPNPNCLQPNDFSPHIKALYPEGVAKFIESEHVPTGLRLIGNSVELLLQEPKSGIEIKVDLTGLDLKWGLTLEEKISNLKLKYPDLTLDQNLLDRLSAEKPPALGHRLRVEIFPGESHEGSLIWMSPGGVMYVKLDKTPEKWKAPAGTYEPPYFEDPTIFICNPEHLISLQSLSTQRSELTRSLQELSLFKTPPSEALTHIDTVKKKILISNRRY